MGIKSSIGTVRRRLCPHDYELLWRQVDGGMRGYVCTRCGRTRNE